MKTVYLIALLLISFSIDLFAQAKIQPKVKVDSTNIKLNLIQADLKQLNGLIEDLKEESKVSTDSLSIAFSDIERVEEVLKLKDSWFEKFLPAIIAFLTVAVSSWVSILVASRQIKKDVDVATEQLRSQEALASEQLSLGKEQLEKTIQSSMAQVRANNILQARITWIQDLRNGVSEYFAVVIPLAYKLIPISQLIINGEKAQARTEYDLLISEVGQARKFSSKVKLFLTSGNNEHTRLLEILNELEDVVIKNIPSAEYEARIDTLIGNLESESRKILKETWEQAKSEII